MGSVLRRFLGFTIAACAIAYIIFLAAGASFYAQADEQSKTVWVRDQISPNTHHVAGMVTVPSSCSELTAKVEELSPVLFKLKFTTWDHPYVECLEEPVQKEFYEIVFAPAVGVNFIATMNGQPFPIIVVPYTP